MSRTKKYSMDEMAIYFKSRAGRKLIYLIIKNSRYLKYKCIVDLNIRLSILC